jgi:hypothetical protein
LKSVIKIISMIGKLGEGVELYGFIVFVIIAIIKGK